MTKRRGILVAAVFAMAIGSAFTTVKKNARFLGPFQKVAGCPSIISPCTFISGTACTNLYLDNTCVTQAFKH